MRIASTLTVAICLHFYAGAQAIDNTLSYKNIASDPYFRLNYENDFFSATDKYYTQGIHLEIVAPWTKCVLHKPLIRPNFRYVKYGLGLEHDGYTPTDYTVPGILYGDRPFAACLMLKTFQIAIDPRHRQRFSSALDIGLIGQAAGGMEMQTAIHRWLHDMTPHGWPNQVHNDAIINYQVDYEKQLLSVGRLLSITADAMARAGPLSDKLNLGTTLMFGFFDSPFDTLVAGKQNLRIYAYEHAEVNAVAYDATLEGGMFNRSSPYAIKPSDVTPFVFHNRFGFVVSFRRVYLEYFQSMLSSEFASGNYHVWGGVQIAFGL